MKSPKISVIIPAYNEEQFINGCLRSILRQTIRFPYEIIAVDNNSTDSTVSIIHKYPQITLIKEKTQGVSAARNAGAKIATGTILVFVDADCIVPNDHIQKIISLYSQHPDTAALGGPYVLHDGGPIVRWFTNQMQYYTSFMKYIREIGNFQSLCGGNFAIKKQVYMQLQGFDERLTHVLMCEDMEFALRLKRAGYSVLFDHTLTVVSSYRRMKRSPIITQIARIAYMYKYILQSRFTG